MTHEVTKTFKIDGRFFNVPTVSPAGAKSPKKRKMGNKEAVDTFFRKNPRARGFLKKEVAVKAAEKRSRDFGVKRTRKSR